MSSTDTERRAARRAAAALPVALLLVTLIAGCGSTPPASRKGGFYQDDGPPEKSVSDPAQLADAIPRIEPFHPYANRPYSALGRSYRPMTEDKPYRARGLASWYGRQFHGSKTSSGEIYDMFAATAAHTTLPIPSYARVTNTRTGVSLVVRVNDRGPFKHDRVIDLSYAAAMKLGIASAGTGEVEVVRLTFDDIRAMRGETTNAPVAASVTAPAPPPAPPIASDAPIAPSAATVAPLPAAADTGRWSVQIGAFQQQANADVLRDRVAAQMQQAGSELAAQRPPRVERDGSIFRVLVGAVADRTAALALAQQLERLLGRETLPLMR